MNLISRNFLFFERLRLSHYVAAVCIALTFLTAAAASTLRPYENTNVPDEVEWKETEVPPPPAFDPSKLLTFDVAASSALVYGVDPSTIQISPKDGLIRYVVVASSASGARNVLYEGIRCATGESITYARYSSDGKWIAATDPQWKSMYDNAPSKHPLRLAKAGFCDNAAAAQTVSGVIIKLKTPNFRTFN